MPGLRWCARLTEQQRSRAILAPKKTGNDIKTQAFSDNVVLDYAGVPVSSFTASQKQQLLDLVGLYVGNLLAGTAAGVLLRSDLRPGDRVAPRTRGALSRAWLPLPTMNAGTVRPRGVDTRPASVLLS